jgi:hypothetical protein
MPELVPLAGSISPGGRDVITRAGEFHLENPNKKMVCLLEKIRGSKRSVPQRTLAWPQILHYATCSCAQAGRSMSRSVREYVSSMCGELAKMSEKDGAPFLAYLLKLAEMEAKRDLDVTSDLPRTAVN